MRYDTVTDLFVQLDPGEIALGVGVLKSEEPDLAETYSLHDLVEELFARGRVLDREF